MNRPKHWVTQAEEFKPITQVFVFVKREHFIYNLFIYLFIYLLIFPAASIVVSGRQGAGVVQVCYRVEAHREKRELGGSKISDWCLERRGVRRRE